MTNEIKKVIDPNSPLEKRIKILGETEERILDTSKTQEKIDPVKGKTQYDNTTKAKDYSKIDDLTSEFGGEPYCTHRQPTIF